MATDIFPDEGLDYMLGIFPKAGASPANTWMGLFTSAAGGNAVPASNATIASMGTNYNECSTAAGQWTTYARQTVTGSGWGSLGASTIHGVTGRAFAAAQVSFPAPSATYTPTNPIAGFFLANSLTVLGGSAIYYSNFDDSSTISTLNIGDVVKVTPSFGLGN